MLRFFDAANLVSLAALLAAAAACALAMRGFPAYAMIALIAAGIGDLFDGLIARRLARTEEQRRFGGRLDSLVDACAFGLAPCVLLYAVGFHAWFDSPLLAFFLCCAVWRLAYFDTVGLETEGNTRYYTGLPTTYVALILPLVFLLVFAGQEWFVNGMRMTVFAIAAAMVSPVRVRKPRGVAYGGFVLLAVVVVGLLVWQGPRIHAAWPK